MYHSTHHMDSTPIFQFSAPKDVDLEPPPSSLPINTDSYEIRPGFIAMVQELAFDGAEDANPYTHLREFGYLCACIRIPGMSPETLKWKVACSGCRSCRWEMGSVTNQVLHTLLLSPQGLRSSGQNLDFPLVGKGIIGTCLGTCHVSSIIVSILT